MAIILAAAVIYSLFLFWLRACEVLIYFIFLVTTKKNEMHQKRTTQQNIWYSFPI